MFLSAKILCLYIIILFYFITPIISDCVIRLPQDLAVRPTIYKNVGSKKLKINTSAFYELRLYDSQTIEAHCDTNFQSPQNYETSNTINIECRNGDMYTSANGQFDYYDTHSFECSRLTWHLYESSANFDWCPSNVTSYIMATAKIRHSLTSRIKYLGGICYDIYNTSFNSIYYTLTSNKIENKQVPVLGEIYQPLTEIQHISETFGSNSIPRFDNDQFNAWIFNEDFKFFSMIQHEKLRNTYNDQFASLLEFVWWANLRLYNWKNYIEALEQHVENDKQTYDILAGVSGAVKVPIKKKCHNNYTMEEVVFNTNQKIPFYVWNYLQDRSNSSNDMVIIAINSPFHEVYPEDDIIFCNDRCREISWLKDIRSSFYYSVMGIVFCCNVEEVRDSKRLDGFPERDIKLESLEMLKVTNDFKLESIETPAPITYNEYDDDA